MHTKRHSEQYYRAGSAVEGTQRQSSRMRRTTPRTAISVTLALALLGNCGDDDDAADDSAESVATPAPSDNANSPATTAPSDSAPAEARPPEVTAIRIAGPRIASLLPAFVGIEAGVFAERGLDVEFAELPPPTIPAALVNNEIQMTPLGTSCEAGYREGIGTQLVSVASIGTGYLLVVADGIESIPDLAGERVITLRPGSLPNVVTQRIMEDAGIADQIEFVSITERDTQIAAFRSGQGSAILLAPSDAVLVLEAMPGAHVLDFPRAEVDNAPTQGLCFTTEFIESNPGTVYALIAGWIETIRYIKENRDDTERIISELFHVTPEQATFLYDETLPNLVEYPIPSDEMLANTVDFYTAAGETVTVEQIREAYNLEFAEQVVADLGVSEGEG
jgi:ABC-type nitrate/sulfonate/bicarbonate transport system substrate-binding protein